MIIKRPKNFELEIDPPADYHSTLAALAFSALKTAPTTIARVERTKLIEHFEGFLSSGGIRCVWGERSVTVDPSTKTQFKFDASNSDFDAFAYMLTLASTLSGSELLLPESVDETIQMIVLALRRMHAELEFVGGEQSKLVVERGVSHGIKFNLKREANKIVPQLLLAMSATKESCELLDLFEDNRHDYIFKHFVSGFERASLAPPEPTDELEKRLRKKQGPTVTEFKSRITLTGGVMDNVSEITLKGDAEFAAFLTASALSHVRGKLVLKNYSSDDFSETPLGQLRRMGAEITPLEKNGEGGHLVERSSLKARKVPFEQLHDYPDAMGALALAACASEGTSVIRSSPYNTKREEEQRRRICEVIRTLGVKVAEIEDGVVLEGKRELSGDAIHSENDPICALMAVAATLGTVDQVEIDDISPAVSRWGSSFEKLLKVLPISP